MSNIINLCDQITNYDKIINKSINYLTFKDVISLIFYACDAMSKHMEDPDFKMWSEFYKRFESKIEKQNKLKWPLLSIIRNDYDKRIDIFSTREYIKTKNLLMLLLRLLHIENYKRPYVYKTYQYHKILGQKLSN